jgi:S1-C subfamily serine protease
VVAIGNPFGLRDTLTVGIVSYVNRVSEVANLIQFDAAVNPGNSGGPLANSSGEIVGVVTARIPPDEGDGICYAISSNKAKRVAAALIEYGFFDYPWLGVSTADLTPQIVQDRALETANGALVGEVLHGSPAEAAGIKADDIIVAMDGVPFKDMAELISYLGEFKSPGDTATIGIIRGTTELELSMVIGTRP